MKTRFIYDDIDFKDINELKSIYEKYYQIKNWGLKIDNYFGGADSYIYYDYPDKLLLNVDDLIDIGGQFYAIKDKLYDLNIDAVVYEIDEY